ncbi:hypothetical protein DPMN_111771 [Dreissena polymorpha]|uniref:Uncharacterized protein n=1 Tax=Dreissena polymorpha TaxID=45954 RepID=A0A9D4KFK3_DREPO|nr:hypothetical protein DPMN_111771 [Dreissena polymorpha]
MQSCWKRVVGEEILKQDSSRGLCSLVASRYGLDIASEVVCDDKDVLVSTLGLLKRKVVYAYQLHGMSTCK